MSETYIYWAASRESAGIGWTIMNGMDTLKTKAIDTKIVNLVKSDLCSMSMKFGEIFDMTLAMKTTESWRTKI